MAYEEIRSGFVKGRRDYSCEWCAQKILKGERQFHRVYRFDGDFNDGRMHVECAEAMDKTPREELLDGWIPGDYPRGTLERTEDAKDRTAML